MDWSRKGWPFSKNEQNFDLAKEFKEKLSETQDKVITKVSSKAHIIRSFCNGSIVGYLVGLLATSRPLLAKGQIKTWLLSQLLTGVTVGILWAAASHIRRRKPWYKRG